MRRTHWLGRRKAVCIAAWRGFSSCRTPRVSWPISVGQGTPAEQAGLREGDVIVEFEGQPVPSIDALHKALTAERIGQRCALTVVRGVDKLDLFVTPTENQ